MNKKRKVLFLGLVAALVLIVSPLFPQMQTTVSAAGTSRTTLTIKDEKLYKYLMEYCFASHLSDNWGALISKDDSSRTITLDMEKVTFIKIMPVDVTKDNSMDILKTLAAGCKNLEKLYLEGCNLASFDFSTLADKQKLVRLYLVDAKITKVPDLKLGNLKTLCLSENDLSANGACDAVTGANFPKLECLWLDKCRLSNIDFIKNTGGGVNRPVVGR